MKTYKQNGWGVPAPLDEYVASPTESQEAYERRSGYVEGWNDCLQEVLSAAPQPPAKPEVGAEPVYQMRYLLDDDPGSGYWQDASKGRFDWANEENSRHATEGFPVRWQTRILYAAPDAQAIRDEGVKAMAEAVALLNIGIRALKGGAA